jgi:ADP-heptose:LPS heptosyltransferase
LQYSKLNFQNILVINFGQLGDVVLSLPALKAIKEKFPAAHITLLVGRPGSDVVRIADVSDDQIVVDRVELRDGNKIRSIARILQLIKQIRSRKFDFVIDLHSLSETNFLAFLSKAKHRLLANRENRSLDRLSNFRPKPPLEDKTKHLSDRYLDVLIPLEITGTDREFRFQTSPEDVEYVDKKFFADPLGRTIGLFPGAGHPSRCWILENFAAFAARSENDGFKPAVFLGPEEEAMRHEVAALFPRDTTIIDGLSISQFIAAASRLEAFVTNDTGPMHLAACAGAPILLLLDERAPTTYLPLTDRLEVIHDKTIDKITVDEAYGAAKSLTIKFQAARK